MDINDITYAIRGAAFRVHRHLGPGLLESTYQKCLAYEIRKRGYGVSTEVVLPLIYDDLRVDASYRIDLLVEERVIVEIKSVEALAPIHTAQILTYLRLSDMKVGLLINFNVANLQKGMKRYLLDIARQRTD